MSTVVVRYRTKPEQADENQRLVEAVFAALAAQRPDGLRYMTLRLADNTFVHVAEVTADANPLSELDAFAAFSGGVADRCEPGDGPNPQPATVVGAYGFPISRAAS
jgi:hypothetical protein